MMANTSVNKWYTQVNFVRFAPIYVRKAQIRQDKQKRFPIVIL